MVVCQVCYGGDMGKRGVKHQKTDETIEIVEALAIAGFSWDRIAGVLGIAKTTLNAHYSEELKCAQDRANAKVLATLFSMATSGKDTAATIFWAKCRFGWSTKTEVDITSKGEKVSAVVYLPRPDEDDDPTG